MADAETVGQPDSPLGSDSLPIGPLDDDNDGASDAAVDQIPIELTPAEIIANHLRAEREAKSEAIAAEHAVTKAIEVAIVARQTAEASKELVEKARVEAFAAAQKAKVAIDAADFTKKMSQVKHDDMIQAQSDLKEAITERKEAEDKAESAATGMETAAAAAEAAQAELKVADMKKRVVEKEVKTASDKARAEVTEVRWAKKEADKLQLAAQEAANAEGTALNAIADGETALVQKQEIAKSVAKLAYDLRYELEEAEKAVERAARAVAEFDGEGGAWALRTQEQLKDRENEWKKVNVASTKASKAEADADMAVENAQNKLKACREDHIAKIAATAQAEEAAAEAVKNFAEQTKSSELAAEREDMARKSAVEAENLYQVLHAKMENAQQAASTTFVEKAAAHAVEARQRETDAIKYEELSITAAAEAAEAEEKTRVEMDAATAIAEQKAAIAEKVTDKDKDAQMKADIVNGHVHELDSKVLTLAVAKYTVRGAYMDVEEAKQRALETRTNRRSIAVKDVRILTIGKDKASTEYTIPDKWYVFQQWLGETHNPDMGLWNVRRLLYGIDGKLKSNLDALLSDFVGSALDRRKGPASAKYCKLAGNGLKEAALGQVSRGGLSLMIA